MRYSHILFDADNTLFDFNKAERLALTQTLHEYGCKPSDNILRRYHEINDSWWSRFEKGEVTAQQLYIGRFADLAKDRHLNIDPQRFHDSYVKFLGTHGDMLPGAPELVSLLHDRGCKLYIITNGNPKVQHPRLDSSPIRQLFDGIYISMEIGHSKPSKEYFDYVLADIRCEDHANILVVGDSLRSDISGGAAVGLDTCWFSPNNGQADGGIAPTYKISSLDSILNIVEYGCVKSGEAANAQTVQ